MIRIDDVIQGKSVITDSKPKSQMVRVPTELLEAVEILKQLHREGVDSQITEEVRRMARRTRAGGLNHSQLEQMDRIERLLSSREGQQVQLDRIEGLLGSMRSSINAKIALIPAGEAKAVEPELIPAAVPADTQAERVRKAILAMAMVPSDDSD